MHALNAKRSRLFAPLPALFALACAPSQPISAEVYADYDEERVSVIGSDASGQTLAGSGSSDSCLLVGEQCLEAEPSGEWCEREGGPYDVVLIDGEVVEVICYPPPEGGEGPEVVVADGQQGDIEVPQNANNTAITFDESTNGQPIEGDLNLQGNNVSVYGNGPDETIIDGDVIVSGNNVRLRGVTVTGDVIMSLNNGSLILSRVLGDVVLEGQSTNNSVIVGNDIFGRLQAASNNNIVVGNDVQGAFELTGNNDTCDENFAFADDDEDQLVDEAERGDALACSAGG